MREVYLSDMAVPFLRPNADFYRFLHEPGGDDDRIDGSLCCACRHDWLVGAQKRAIVKGKESSCLRTLQIEVQKIGRNDHVIDITMR